MNTITLVMNEIKKTFRTNLNYPLSVVSNILNNLIFIGLMLIVFSSIFDINHAFTTILWPFILAVVLSAGDSLQNDMQLGTLERILAKNNRFFKLLLARMFTAGVFTIPMIIFFLIIIYYKTDNHITSMLNVGVITLPLILTSFGLGFFIAGLTLYHKELGSFPNLFMLIILGFTIIPLDQINNLVKYSLALIIPFFSIKSFILEGEIQYFYFALINSSIFFGGGIIIFKYTLALTKKKIGFGRY